MLLLLHLLGYFFVDEVSDRWLVEVASLADALGDIVVSLLLLLQPLVLGLLGRGKGEAVLVADDLGEGMDGRIDGGLEDVDDGVG